MRAFRAEGTTNLWYEYIEGGVVWLGEARVTHGPDIGSFTLFDLRCPPPSVMYVPGTKWSVDSTDFP
jgi:hypothetical protein